MANSFSKEERVAFEDILEGFNDALVMSSIVSKYNTNGTQMERSSDTIWRPMPYIAQSYDGSDATSNFGDSTQLAVPATIGYQKHSTALLTAKELRDQLQENRLGSAAAQKLASDINVSTLTVASNQGTIVAARSTAASGYNDVAEADALMNEQGVMMDGRSFALSSRDYNGMAGDLAARETMNNIPTEAYRRSYVGEVAGFQTFKMDYANRLTAAAGVTVTVNGANQYHTPAATSTAGTGEVSNVDNRTQSLIIGVSSGTVKVGDAFTIVGVNAVHHITKQDTGQLKTFRITAIVSGSGGAGTVTISPAIVSGQGATDAELQYQNVTATPANGAAIVFLNTVAAPVNCFWHRDAIELLPASLAVPTDAGADIMRATTDQGLELVMQKQFDINTQKTKYRWDTLFGVAMVQPEMAGIMLFSQT
tara:strand:+ start:1458 stop:2726 length:1269 start_codon:yes stop_codon:yes gene_type:complete